MVIMSSLSIQDLARAINEKRHLTPEELTRSAIVVIDDAPARAQEEGASNE